ncbi:MAG TPA: DNA polymerase ligase N-terminal domain-containing protein [Acidimicrobiales bacterium]|nr:DNA polymerase ligase N-terminal domain-containing protein [Acidimicrobiales bacterium]
MTPPDEDRLRRYRDKRDFSVTAEPAGAGPPPAGDGHRFVVQRHRARRLHYDVRLEMGGVLVSWAVPKGPTLDPDARRLAVHVEDHPLDYFDFEGTIPRGEYGGGDVIVWDWGTWSLAKGDDPLAAVEGGDLHVDLAGERLAGRFVFVRKGGGDDWLLLHKHDDHAVAGWDAEDHPTSVKTGRTNDEVRAAGDATWSSTEGLVTGGAGPGDEAMADGARPEIPTWDPPTPDELAALDALGAKGEWELQGRTLKLTNLDKVLFPGREGGEAVTKRDVIRYHARVAPALLPYLYDRPVNTLRFPDGVERPGFWHKEAPSHAPSWITRWTYPDADPGDTQTYIVADSPPALAWLANYAALELSPWTSPASAWRQPTWALIDLDPGPKSTFDDVIVLARLHKVALDRVGVQAGAKVTGKRGIQIWIPVAPGPSFDDTRGWVETISRAVGKVVPEMVSWAWTKRDRGGLARLDYTQNAINKTLVAPFTTRPAPGAPVSVPIAWEELDDPDLAPDRWTVRTVLDRLATTGDPLRPLVGLPQRLPDL